MTATSRSAVTIWVDPICPFAWLTSRWLLAVQHVRPVDVAIEVMSLSVLNEHRSDLSAFYADLVATGWGPARVSIAVIDHAGPAGFARFYTEFGRRHHVERHPLDRHLLVDALTACDLPTSLADAAATSEHDEALRTSHTNATAVIGDDAGTPILHITTPHHPNTAIFGPVITRAPHGDHAGTLWDGVAALASCHDFAELQRPRTRPLDFS